MNVCHELCMGPRGIVGTLIHIINIYNINVICNKYLSKSNIIHVSTNYMFMLNCFYDIN